MDCAPNGLELPRPPGPHSRVRHSSTPVTSRCLLLSLALVSLALQSLALPQRVCAQPEPTSLPQGETPNGEAAGSTAGAPAAESEKPPSPYRQLINEAVSEYRLGHFAEARALFGRAHGLRPNARTLRGMGMASYELRNYVECVSELTMALTSSRSPLQGRLRASTERLLTRAQAFVGTVELTVTPTDAQVMVDNRPVESRRWSALALNLGEHVIEVTAPGHRRARRRIEIRGGESQALDIHLRVRHRGRHDGQEAVASTGSSLSPGPRHPLGAVEAASSQRLPAPLPTNSSQPPPQDDLLENPWLWTGVGAAVVVVIVGTALAVSGGSDSNDDSYGGSSGTTLVSF